MTLQIPDRYELRKLGPSGGQASIAYFRDKWLERNVVMKTPLMPGAGYDVAAEVRSLAAVQSKHVVGVFDTIRDKYGNIEAIVEEDVEGQLLSAEMATGMNMGRKLSLLYQIACGVADMHRAGRIHRDLKPNNMKVRPDGLLKIFDFGISTILADGDQTQIGKGTRGFRAPELSGKPPITVTDRCDCYSFGVIAHQLFADGNLATAFLNKPPSPLATGISFTHIAGISRRLREILSSCLEVDPSTRPCAVELRDAIASEIVKNRHRAVISTGAQQFVVNAANPAVKVGEAGCEITIEYNGTRFVVKAVTGAVFINNGACLVGQELSGAMVITLGAPTSGANRRFVTFDISHPEILV